MPAWLRLYFITEIINSYYANVDNSTKEKLLNSLLKSLLKNLEEKTAEVLFGYRIIILRVVICMATWYLHLFAV